jgi:phosphonate transport system substrate-binding protein
MIRPLARAAALAAGLAAVLVTLGSCGQGRPSGGNGTAAAPKTLNFSVLSAEDQASYEPLWRPLLDDLSKAAGVPVKPFFSSNYGALVQAMRFDQVQIGWFSALPAVETIDRASGAVFARTADLRGKDTYNAIVVVKKGSGLTLDRVLKCDRTLDFGMGDPSSTSGTLAPMAFLFKPRNIDPQTCFKTVRSASHNANLFAVTNGVLDAATMNSVTLDFAREGDAANKHAFELAQVIWTSPALPESALVYRKDLAPALQARIRAFFLGYGKAPGAEGERQRQIMAKLHYSEFRPADDGYLQPIRQMRDAAAPAGAS